MENKPTPPKPPTNKREIVYYLYTLDGTRHYITKEEYDELSVVIKDSVKNGGAMGIFVSQPSEDEEFIAPSRHIVSIGRPYNKTSGAINDHPSTTKH